MTKNIATIKNIDEEIFQVILFTWRMSTQLQMDKIQHSLAVVLDLLKEWGSC